jgi:hypothetical protein
VISHDDFASRPDVEPHASVRVGGESEAVEALVGAASARSAMKRRRDGPSQDRGVCLKVFRSRIVSWRLTATS